MVVAKKIVRHKIYFKNFFKNLNYLIKYLTNNEEKLMQIEKDFINEIKYYGIVYRYLGHAELTECKKRIIPEFNSIWVSWSKEKYNSYIETKLYGKRTRLYCNIKSCYYGIDLEAFQKFCIRNEVDDYYIKRR